MTLSTLAMASAAVNQLALSVAKRQGQRDMLLAQRAESEKAAAEATAKIGQFDLVQILLQETSDFAREQAKGRIEDIVTQALQVVFGADYRFHIVLDTRGHLPVVEFRLQKPDMVYKHTKVKDGETAPPPGFTLKPPDYDSGGGEVDVISFALRLAVMELSDVQGPLFADEIGKHVSKEYAPNVAYFLRQYSREFGRQIILITHNDDLATVGDLSLSVSCKGGESVVERA